MPEVQPPMATARAPPSGCLSEVRLYPVGRTQSRAGRKRRLIKFPETLNAVTEYSQTARG
jgi:hypothetical protein